MYREYIVQENYNSSLKNNQANNQTSLGGRPSGEACDSPRHMSGGEAVKPRADAALDLKQSANSPTYITSDTGGAGALRRESVPVPVGPANQKSSSFPSLVIYGQSKVKPTWSRRQKRLYKNLSSWISIKKGEGAQILRVDLTSIEGSNYNLTEKLQRLRKLIEKTFHYRIQYFKVETSEGNGVLHMIWAIKHPSPVYISQKWLSDAWKHISGAYIVYICKLATRRQSKKGRQYKFRTIEKHIRDIASYMATQYIADQSAIVRVSWSWWRGDVHIREAFKQFIRLAHIGRYVPGEGLHYLMLPRWKLYHGWTELLLHRLWKAEDRTFILNQEGVMCEYN